MTLRGEYWWLHCLPDGIYWACCFAHEAEPRSEGRSRQWSDLPVPEGATVILCVPGEMIRVHTVSIPTRSRKRFLAALPYELEDQLLREPDDYHFVPLQGPGRSSGTAVAVVEQRVMSDWMTAVSERGWRMHALFPDFLAMPEPMDDTWLFDVSMQPLLLRLPAGRGGAALPGGLDDHPPGALILALEHSLTGPETLQVRVADQAQEQKVSRWREMLTEYGIELDIQTANTTRSAWLARQTLPDKSFSLLTGGFKPREKSRDRRLVPVTYLSAALLIVLAVHWIVEGRRIHSEHRQLEESIETVYRQAFPDARHVVDPRFQMEQRLQELRESNRKTDASADGGLVSWLERLAPALSSGKSNRLLALDFEGDRITLEMNVADYESLERLRERLARTDVVIEVETAELREDHVHAVLEVRGRT